MGSPNGWRRRAVLGAIAGTAGCARVIGRGRPTVSVLAAGSLQPTLRDLQETTDERVEAEAMGSAAAARLVESGRRDPDVVVLADASLLPALADWHARIATNELAIAYTRETPGGQAVGNADRWFDPILAGRASLGRTDPKLDPLGYRTLFLVGLGERFYDEPNLSDRVLAADQIYPETGLLSQFETGSVDAAVVYRSMAVDRGYPRIDLPAAIDLSDPAATDRYSQQSYTLPDGTTVRGGLVEYGATLLTDDEAAMSVFEVLTDGQLLADHGFSVPGRYPSYVGDVPDTVG